MRLTSTFWAISFEKYINQKAFGAYYTRTEITEYLCGRTIHRLILNAINTSEVSKAHPIPGVKVRNYQTIAELLMDLDKDLCRELLFKVLPNLSLLDPPVVPEHSWSPQ